jgi:hypothetical protein
VTTKILVIPDSQVKPDVDTSHLRAIGNYIVAKQPEIIVHLGDFADMPSLSSYDRGKKSFEGRRYKNDINAAKAAMGELVGPLREYNATCSKNKKRMYAPQMHMLYGNHEHRIVRAINDDSKLDGTIGLEDLEYEKFGWTTHPFLEIVQLGGICFSHYFVSGVMGRPVTTAAALLQKKHMSCIAGHQQGKQISTAVRADGKQITAIIAGSAYAHHEDYLTPQGNAHWNGIVMCYDVRDGEFDEGFVSLKYLMSKYA